MPTTTKGRLNIAIDQDAVEMLRDLAGGERKVGEFLGDMARFLWSQRTVLESAKLNDLALMSRAGLDVMWADATSKLDEISASTEETKRAYENLVTEYEERKAQLEEMIDEMQKRRAESDRLIERLERLETRREETPAV